MDEIEQIKFYNSVKIGSQEIVSLHSANGVKAFIDGYIIKLTDDVNIVYATIYNVVWYKLKKDTHASEQTTISSVESIPSKATDKKDTRPKLSKAK